MLDNRWLGFILVSSTLFLIGYFKPLDKKIRLKRKGLLQDIFFWVIFIDLYFHPLIEASLESKFNQTYQDFISFIHLPQLFDKISIATLALPIQFIIVFCIMELINYCVHRFIKHGNQGWNFHKTHHSSQELDQFSDARNHPIMIILETFLFALPTLMILNPDVSVMALYGVVGLIWGPLIHHNIRVKWPFPISHILSSPHTHRWHHAREKGIHCNFAGIFILYDVIFGTFYSPNEDCQKIGFEGDESFPQTAAGMMLYPFKEIYNKINLPKFLARKDE
jgi:sterol desaturase/sphingolipid hydroxylase (fatty acid hydroxylase superfamily)